MLGPTTTRRVQLRFGRHVHPVYREQLAAVPPGWEYAYTHPDLDDAAAPTKKVQVDTGPLARIEPIAERLALRALSALGYVHRVRPHALPGISLIHAAERLLFNPPVPYVVDVEHADLFVLYQQAAWDRPWAREIVERALLDDRLKYVLGWSDMARRSVLAVVSSDVARQIEPKLKVVYPAARLAVKRPRRRETKALRALFVGTKFPEKGGVSALRALREVRRTHDVELDMVTFAPLERRAELESEPGLRLHQPGGADLVRRLYAQSDVLLFPSHMDTYGVVVGEAMSYGLPVIAPRHLALTETIRDGVSGLLFAPENMLWQQDTRCRFRHTLPVPDSYLKALQHPSDEFVRGIAEALARLAEDAVLHAQLAEGAFESVRSGHLSIEHRRAQLHELYDDASQ